MFSQGYKPDDDKPMSNWELLFWIVFCAIGISGILGLCVGIADKLIG